MVLIFTLIVRGNSFKQSSDMICHMASKDHSGSCGEGGKCKEKKEAEMTLA